MYAVVGNAIVYTQVCRIAPDSGPRVIWQRCQLLRRGPQVAANFDAKPDVISDLKFPFAEHVPALEWRLDVIDGRVVVAPPVVRHQPRTVLVHELIARIGESQQALRNTRRIERITTAGRGAIVGCEKLFFTPFGIDVVFLLEQFPWRVGLVGLFLIDVFGAEHEVSVRKLLAR